MAVYCDNCGYQNRNNAKFCKECGQEIILTTENGTLAPGVILDNRYEIKRLIKSGGMGSVYEAIDNRFKSTCAVKEMLNLSDDPERMDYLIKRFKEEARILHELKHPNLPVVRDYFVEAGRYYLVMEYIEGEDLETLTDYYDDGQVPQELVIEWTKQILDALEYLHTQSPPIVYRDLKPGNVMLRSKDKKVMLVDFGIARVIDPTEKVTKTSTGTPSFAPIEVFRGKPEPRSDIYSLGATMHCLLTGVMSDALDFIPVRMYNSKVSEDLEFIVMKALSLEAMDRYGNTKEMREAIDKLSISSTKRKTKLQALFYPSEEAKVSNQPVQLPVMDSVQEENVDLDDPDAFFKAFDLPGSPEKKNEEVSVPHKSPANIVPVSIPEEKIKEQEVVAGNVSDNDSSDDFVNIRTLKRRKIEPSEPGKQLPPKKKANLTTPLLSSISSIKLPDESEKQAGKDDKELPSSKSNVTSAILPSISSIKLPDKPVEQLEKDDPDGYFAYVAYGEKQSEKDEQKLPCGKEVIDDELFPPPESVEKIEDEKSVSPEEKISVKKDNYKKPVKKSNTWLILLLFLVIGAISVVVGLFFAKNYYNNSEKYLKLALGEMKKSNGDKELIKNYYNKAKKLKLDKKNMDLLLEISHIAMEKDPENAIGYCTDAIILDKSNEEAHKNYIKIGQYFYNKRDYKNAIKYFSDIQDAVPSGLKTQVLTDLGKSYVALKDYDNVIKIYEELLSINPSSELYKDLGTACYNKKNYEKTIEYLSKVQKTDKNNPEILKALSKSYFAMKNYDKVIEVNEKLASISPSVDVYTELGTGYHKKNKYEKAISSFNSAQKLKPSKDINKSINDLKILCYLSIARGDFDKKKYDVAKGNLKNIIKIDKNNKKAIELMANCNLKLGEGYLAGEDLGKAKECFASILKLKPGSKIENKAKSYIKDIEKKEAAIATSNTVPDNGYTSEPSYNYYPSYSGNSNTSSGGYQEVNPGGSGYQEVKPQ